MTVELHLATTIDELNYIAIQQTLQNNYRTTRPAILYKIARSLYQQYSKNPHDDELAYVFAYRFLKLLEVLYIKDKDQHFLRTQFDVWRIQASEALTKLREILTVRYSELGLRSSPVPTRKLSISEDEPSQQRNVFGPAIDGFITSKQFYNGLQTVKDDVLIMDVRPALSFAESRLHGNYNLINIDDFEIEKGISAFKFEEKLSKDVKETFARRDLFGYIVLMDMDSTKDSFPTSKLKILYDMLTVWDVNKKYQRTPFVLNGGYMDFIDMYPSLSTNSNVICKQRYADLDDLLNLDDITYPPLADKDEAPKPVMPPMKMEPDISDQLEHIYKEILYTAEKLHEIENQLLLTELDIAKQVQALLERDDPHLQRIKENLEFEKESMEEEKAMLNERKVGLILQIQIVLKSVPNCHEGNYLKRPDLVTVETSTVELSRKRRKLGEEPKKTDKGKVEPKLEQTPSGDTMIQKVIPTSEPKKKPVQKPPMSVKKPCRPPVNRATKPTIHEVDTDLGVNGLVNIRNTCYMNSILQCLRHLPVLKNFFVSGDYKNQITKTNPKLIVQFADLVGRLWNGSAGIIRPQEFYSKLVNLHPIFGKGQHEDANEFYMLVLNFISEDTSTDLIVDGCWAQQVSSFYRSLLYKKSHFAELFYFQIRSDCTCSDCGQHIHKFDTENTIMLAPPSSGHGNMQEMLDDYMSKCDISNLYCKDCETPPAVTRKFTFQPRILTIMFKRYSLENGIITKITTPCSFPLNCFVLGNATYRLWGVCLHSGSMNAGHYTAACLNWLNNTWYEFNDENVYPIDLRQNTMETAAYMLFYQITDERLAGFTQA